MKPSDTKEMNIVQRYPVVFLCDYGLVAMLVLLCGMWFAKKNGVGIAVFEFVTIDHPTITFWVFIGLFVVVFLGLAVVLWMKYKAKPKRK